MTDIRSQPSSRSGPWRHGFPPAPKSVRVWPVRGPSCELNDLVPSESPLPSSSKTARIPLWAVQLSVFLALLIIFVALVYLTR